MKKWQHNALSCCVTIFPSSLAWHCIKCCLDITHTGAHCNQTPHKPSKQCRDPATNKRHSTLLALVSGDDLCHLVEACRATLLLLHTMNVTLSAVTGNYYGASRIPSTAIIPSLKPSRLWGQAKRYAQHALWTPCPHRDDLIRQQYPSRIQSHRTRV